MAPNQIVFWIALAWFNAAYDTARTGNPNVPPPQPVPTAVVNHPTPAEKPTDNPPPPPITDDDPGPPPTPKPKPVVEPNTIIVGPLLPSADMPTNLSAIRGQMVRVQLDNVKNCTLIDWEIEPEPDDVIISEDKTKLVFSSSIEGTYQVRADLFGPGGHAKRKCKALYGTTVDGNVLAPARENREMDEEPTFATIVTRSYRRCADPDKERRRFDVADAIDDVVALTEGPNPNITSRTEIPGAFKDAFRKKMHGKAYVDWSPFVVDISQGLSDAFDSGQATTLEQYVSLLKATAEILRTK